MFNVVRVLSYHKWRSLEAQWI